MLLTLLGAINLNAQSPTALASPTQTLPTMVVTADPQNLLLPQEAATATRNQARILDTPRSIQIVPRALIDAQGLTDPQDAVKNVSGIVRAASFNGISENFTIRGFRQTSLVKDGFRVGSSSNSVLNATGATDLANIGSIEFLKGPSAILFGRGEPGGIVNYLTRLPTFENKSSIQQQVGSDAFYRTSLSSNVELMPGKVAARLDAAYENSGSFIDRIEGDRFFAAPSILWQVDPDTTVTFRGEYSTGERSTDPGIPLLNGRPIPGTAYDVYLGEPGLTRYDMDSLRGLLEIQHRWNDENTTKLSLHSRKSQSDGAYVFLVNLFGPAYDPSTGQITRSLARTDAEDENHAIRIDHTYDALIYQGTGLTVKNQLLLSLEFERETRDTARILSGQAPLNVFNPQYTGLAPLPFVPRPGFPKQFNELARSEATATSLMLMDRISFNEQLFLSFGGRLEWFDTNRSNTFTARTFRSSKGQTDSTTFNPTLGLVYKPISQISLYTSYAESTSSFQNVGRTTVNGADLEPERSSQYEIGVKAEWLDGKLTASSSVFQIEKSNVAGSDLNNPLFSVNSGEERSRGVEFDLAAQPLPGWTILANYAYVDSRITADPTEDPLDSTLGNARYGVPQNTAGIFTNYEIQDGPLKGLGFGSGATFIDRVQTSNFNENQLPGYATIDALLYYQHKNWRAQLNVNNLADKQYYYAENVFGTGKTALRGGGRNVLVSLKYDF